MLEAIVPIINVLKEARPSLYGGVFIATSLMLFLPDSMVVRPGLTEFRQLYRAYFGMAFIASASLLVVHFARMPGSFVMNKVQEWRVGRDLFHTLSELTIVEKEFLKRYITNDDSTVYTSISNGTARSLEAKHIIYRASSISTPETNFPYNLQPIVRIILLNHPHLLA